MVLIGGSRVKRAGIVRRRRWPMVAATSVGTAMVLVTGFFAWNYFNDKDDNSDSAVSQKIIEKVSQLYVIPDGEEPTVAQIKDKEKLNGQSFFDKATNGDYLLVYTDSKLALLYREEANKLVNVGPISSEGQGQVGGASADIPADNP